MEGDQYVCYQSPGNKQLHDVKQVPQFKNVQQYAKKERKKGNSFMMTTTLTAIGISAYHLLPPVVSTVLMYFSKDE